MRSLVVFLTVLSLVGFLLLLWTLVEYLDWSSGISSTAPRLTFNAFEKLYALNSSKWKFFSNYVVYYPNGGTDNETMVIEFLHFHDVVRYKFFRDRLEANKEELERIRKEQEFLGYEQNIITTHREENLREMKRILEK